MNPAYPQNAYPGYRPNTQPPPGMQMMDPNIAQMAQQRYMQQHQQQLAQMHAAGMIPPQGQNFPGGPPGQGQGQGMRMPPGMPMGQGMNMGQGMMNPNMNMGMGGMNMGMGMGMPQGQGPPQHGQGQGQGQGGPSSIPQHHQQMYQNQHAPHPPKQKKKPGPQPKHTPASQMIPHRAPPTSAEQYMKNAMLPPSNSEAEPWADALDELDPRELAMNRFRTRNEMLEEVFGPEPIKSIPLGKGDAWEGLGMDGETLEAKVAALEKENQELEASMDERLSSWTQHLASLETGEATHAGVTA